MPPFQNRMVERRMVTGRDLMPNPLNYRSHPSEQRDFMQHILETIGWVSATMAVETPDGLMLLDGELRSRLSPEEELPVDVLDLDPREQNIILAAYDASTSMAGRRPEVADELRQQVDDEYVVGVFDHYQDHPVLTVEDEGAFLGDNRAHATQTTTNTLTLNVALTESQHEWVVRAIQSARKKNGGTIADALMSLAVTYVGIAERAEDG